MQKVMNDASGPGPDAALKQDVEDLTALEVTKTPTFFVNGKPMPTVSYEALQQLVSDEMKVQYGKP